MSKKRSYQPAPKQPETAKPDNIALSMTVQTNADGSFHALHYHDAPPMAAMGGGNGATKIDVAAMPSTVFRDERARNRYAEFGTGDKLANTMLDAHEEVPQAANAIKFNANALWGQGLLYVLKSDLAQGQSNAKRAWIEEIETFLTQNSILTEFLDAQAYDLATFENAFSEAIFNRAHNKIVQLVHKEFEYSRISRAVPDKGIRDRQYLYYSGIFPSGRIRDTDFDDSSRVSTIQLLNYSIFSGKNISTIQLLNYST